MSVLLYYKKNKIYYVSTHFYQVQKLYKVMKHRQLFVFHTVSEVYGQSKLQPIKITTKKIQIFMIN